MAVLWSLVLLILVIALPVAGLVLLTRLGAAGRTDVAVRRRQGWYERHPRSTLAIWPGAWGSLQLVVAVVLWARGDVLWAGFFLVLGLLGAPLMWWAIVHYFERARERPRDE